MSIYHEIDNVNDQIESFFRGERYLLDLYYLGKIPYENVEAYRDQWKHIFNLRDDLENKLEEIQVRDYWRTDVTIH